MPRNAEKRGFEVITREGTKLIHNAAACASYCAAYAARFVTQ
jgi:hypothetical protein